MHRDVDLPGVQRYFQLMREKPLAAAMVKRLIAPAGGGIEIARSADGPLASSELFVMINLPKRSTGTDANVPLRGTGGNTIPSTTRPRSRSTMLIDSPPVLPTYRVFPSLPRAIWCGSCPTGIGFKKVCFAMAKPARSGALRLTVGWIGNAVSRGLRWLLWQGVKRRHYVTRTVEDCARSAS